MCKPILDALLDKVEFKPKKIKWNKGQFILIISKFYIEDKIIINLHALNI